MIPDAEAIIGTYLRTHTQVAALGARIVGQTPSDTIEPWVRLTQLDASNEPRSRPEHLIDYLIQCDCYAGRDGGQAQASLLARTVRAALDDMPSRSHTGAVVTRVKFTSMPRIPDTDYEPARERYILSGTVHMHGTS